MRLKHQRDEWIQLTRVNTSIVDAADVVEQKAPMGDQGLYGWVA